LTLTVRADAIGMSGVWNACWCIANATFYRVDKEVEYALAQ
jgi:hypothetical protein